MGISSLPLLIICGILFSVGGVLASWILVKGSKNSAKSQAYECGIPAKGSGWVQFSVGYYLFALIFLVFDVELIFLYPWAVVVKKIGMLALVEIVIFIFILFLGLIYAHKKGALKWM